MSIFSWLFPDRSTYTDPDGGVYRITDSWDRRDRIANIRGCVTNAVMLGLWSKEMYEEYISAHPMPVRRRPIIGKASASGRGDVLSDFEIAYWEHGGSPAPADLI